MLYVTRITFIILSFILSGLSLASSGITYHGRILRPDNSPVNSATTQFRIQIKTPGAESCLLWEFFKQFASAFGVWMLKPFSAQAQNFSTSFWQRRGSFGTLQVSHLLLATATAGDTRMRTSHMTMLAAGSGETRLRTTQVMLVVAGKP